MSGFEPLKINFCKQEKIIDASNVMRAAAEVESFIPYGSMHTLFNARQLNFALVTGAYCALLRYAGFKFDEREVLQKLSSGECSQEAAESILALFAQYNPISVDDTKKKPVKRSRKTSK